MFLKIFPGYPSRASSKKTRIETRKEQRIRVFTALFEGKFQENKDWNQEEPCPFVVVHLIFEGKFQENKDWNLYMYVDTAMILFSLRGQVPRKQGLKRVEHEVYIPSNYASRASSKKTRIETRYR